MRLRLGALGLVVYLMAGCASPNPKAIAPMKGQDDATRRADVAACDEQVPESGRSTATTATWMALVSLPFGGLMALAAPMATAKERNRYGECLQNRGYQVTWE